MDPKAIAALARSAQVGPAKTEPYEWFRTARMAQCTGKAAFSARFLATKVAKRMAGRGKNGLQPYRCEKCGRWHLGER